MRNPRGAGGLPTGQRSRSGGVPIGDRQEDSPWGMGWGGELPMGGGQGAPHLAGRRGRVLPVGREGRRWWGSLRIP